MNGASAVFIDLWIQLRLPGAGQQGCKYVDFLPHCKKRGKMCHTRSAVRGCSFVCCLVCLVCFEVKFFLNCSSDVGISRVCTEDGAVSMQQHGAMEHEGAHAQGERARCCEQKNNVTISRSYTSGMVAASSSICASFPVVVTRACKKIHVPVVARSGLCGPDETERLVEAACCAGCYN